MESGVSRCCFWLWCEQILERITASAARDRICVAGYVSRDELERLYARAAIFAFPSLDEGFGIPVLEAMAHGVPVVTSNCSALPEVAGSSAVLVDPKDVSSIAGALSDLIANPEKRAALREAGCPGRDCFLGSARWMKPMPSIVHDLVDRR